MKQIKKFNCWDYMNCGREPSGNLVHDFGVCPASLEHRLDTIHGGKNAGRACWVVAGSLISSEKVHCIFAKVYKDCTKCEFFIMVREEEGSTFMEKEKLWKRLQLL